LLLLLSALSFADIPPPDDYVETCTLKIQGVGGRDCNECAGYHGGREPCEALEKDGYLSVCRTHGASVWTEVVCKPGPDGASPVKITPPPKKTRCDTGGGGNLAWLPVLALAAVRRRR
jgi:hypothetical protein